MFWDIQEENTSNLSRNDSNSKKSENVVIFCPGPIMHIIHHSLGETFTLEVGRIKTMFPCKSDLICPKEQIFQSSCLHTKKALTQ